MTQNINKRSRFMVLAVGVMMSLVFITPMWKISMKAPQYPEGLSMYIWVNKISGGTPYDLKNINLLNHYIGMDEIVEKSIPELTFMPYILVFMIAGALVTVLFPRLFMVYLGIINLILIAIAGLYDFWRWEYNYGHNLNPEAPIIVPGMSYQPPLLFCKEILNINACSFPHIGAVLLFLSLAVLVFVIYTEKYQAQESQ